MENIFLFNHEKENLFDALGVSNETDDKCREMIFFATISNHFLSVELFDSPENAPRSLTTVTGDLEKTLSLTENLIEKQYCLLLFKHMHKIAIHSLARWKAFQKMDEEEKTVTDLMMKLIDIKRKQEDEDSDNVVSTPEMNKRIELVLENKFSFESYFEKIQGNNSKKEEANIDDYLDNLLKKMNPND